MTDIVERLRDWQIRSFRSNHDDALEAADEIEKLKAEKLRKFVNEHSNNR